MTKEGSSHKDNIITLVICIPHNRLSKFIKPKLQGKHFFFYKMKKISMPIICNLKIDLSRIEQKDHQSRWLSGKAVQDKSERW